jgi:nucleoid DNA-binding protein
MKIASLSKVILLLLEKGKEVSLEGIGNFFIKKESARIDEKSSIAHPPTQTILFNPDIHYYDSALLHHVAEAMVMDLEQAKMELSELLRDIVQRIIKGEIVVLEGIGSLLMGDNGRIKFKSLESTSVVLPEVELPNLTKSIDETPLVMVRNGRGFHNYRVRTAILIPIILVVIFGIFRLIGFDFWDKNESLPAEKVLAEVPSSRLNVKPQDANDVNLPQEAEKNTVKEYPNKELQPVTTKVPLATRREEQNNGASVESGSEYSGTALIGVGFFSLEEEAEILQTSLERVDYETIIRTAGNYLQLGVIVPYQSKDQLDAILLSIRRNFVSDAKIETLSYVVE